MSETVITIWFYSLKAIIMLFFSLQFLKANEDRDLGFAIMHLVMLILVFAFELELLN